MDQEKKNGNEKEKQQTTHKDDQEKKDHIEGINKLREIGLKEVSEKTFINLENLNYLLDRKFDKLNKTKAFGFIYILERDFKVDLSELKKEYLAYQNRGKKKKLLEKIHPEQKIKAQKTPEKETITKVQKRTNTSQEEKRAYLKASPSDFPSEKSYKKYLPLLLLPILAYGIYQWTNNKTPKGIDTSVMDLNVVQNDNITKEAQENLIALDEEENGSNDDTQEDIDLNRVVKEMFHDEINESQESNISITTAQNANEQETNQSQEPNQTKKPSTNDSQQALRKTQQLINAPANEENISLEKVDASTIENSENNTTQVKESTKEKEPKEEIAKQEKSIKQTTKSSVPSGIYFKAIKKAWVGVIYLDTFQKKDYLVKHYLRLNPRRDQIILVGHRHFRIYHNKKEVKFRSKKMVRFLYENGKLREISKDEYIQRSGGVTW